MKRSRHEPALSERELSERYDFLLSALPDSVVDRAHADVLERSTPAVRDDVRAVLNEPAGTDDAMLAAAVGAALHRDPGLHSQLAPALAAGFIRTAPVAAYFSTGVGSVTIDQQPLWVQELVAHEIAPIDSTAVHRRIGYSGVDML